MTFFGVLRANAEQCSYRKFLRYLILSIIVLPLVWKHTLVYLIPVFCFGFFEILSAVKTRTLRLTLDITPYLFFGVVTFLLFVDTKIVSPASYPDYFEWGSNLQIDVSGPWFSVVLKFLNSFLLMTLVVLPFSIGPKSG